MKSIFSACQPEPLICLCDTYGEIASVGVKANMDLVDKVSGVGDTHKRGSGVDLVHP